MKLLRLISIALVVLFTARLASAEFILYCLRPDVSKAFAEAKAVFVGEVVKVVPPTGGKTGPLPGRAYKITFNIERSWKGMPFGQIDVWALDGNYEAAMPLMKVGERYLVYALGTQTNELTMNSCNRSARLPDSSPTSRLFGKENDPLSDIRILDAMLILPPRNTR